MSKYDWITKEYLEDLYIKQNLSRQQVCNILNISFSTFGRKRKEFNIHKSIQFL